MTAAPPIRMLIADDHTLMRQGLREICEGLGGCQVVGEARSGLEAVALCRTTRPDVTLMDMSMPEMDGAAAIRRIMQERPTSRIIALTMYRDESYLLAAVRGGARAYLLKTVDAADLIDAIKAVHRGEYLVDPIIAARVLGELHLPQPTGASRPAPLADKEVEVLRLLAKGYDNNDIADELHLSVHTVSNRLRTIFEKLHVTNRTQAALYALRQGWASLDDAS